MSSKKVELTKEGKLILNVADIADDLTTEERLHLLRFIGITDDFIKDIVDVILNPSVE